VAKVMSAPIGIVALLLAAFAAGCGGSDSNGSTETVTATTGASERLTAAQWEEYQTSRAALRKANAAATTKLDACAKFAGFQDSAQLQACVGDVFSELAVTAGDARSTLTSFDGTVSGPCAEALDGLLNYVGTFQASAHQMQVAVESETLAGYPAASDSLSLAESGGKEEAKTFEQECAPV